MKISIKTLKGDVFQIDVELSDAIPSVKEKIAAAKSDLVAERQKLVHAGKVLSDNATLESSGIKEHDFIVCMVTKESAKPKSAAPAFAAPTTPAAAPAPFTAPPIANAAPRPVVPVTPASPSIAAAASSTPATASTPTVSFPPEVVRNLTDMGFPESEVQAALRAARGNSDLAVEYLMSGIPDRGAASSVAPTSGAPPTGAAAGLEQLRYHPQFNQLKRLVHENPAALGQVLEAIGQQNPELLRLIHANQSDFLAMMNEPIVDTPVAPVSAAAGAAGMDPSAVGANPLQFLQMIQSLPSDQRAQAAQAIGVSPEQLDQLTQLMSTLPPEQMQALLGGAMGGSGGGPSGPNIIRLTDDEMQAVTRLTELGFDQQDAVAAYLACDKNEALAANLLLEGWQGGDNDDFGGGGGDNMYS